ncbi:hypothetical protein FNV43_RR21521 [Rhamnella rubrinervis]|uniref:Uncharacterized protein n=1 Tax=Rhamnella rubrinervis TaxID=2594499 RepID=A0A8K0E8K8_9ROSA|nr:hypothetical protein FNV43_RR21521 [Rhamnella rubrinervis]
MSCLTHPHHSRYGMGIGGAGHPWCDNGRRSPRHDGSHRGAGRIPKIPRRWNFPKVESLRVLGSSWMMLRRWCYAVCSVGIILDSRGTLWAICGPVNSGFALKLVRLGQPRNCGCGISGGLDLMSRSNARNARGCASRLNGSAACRAWLQLIRSHAWSASLSHRGGLLVGAVWLHAAVYELWYGCVCLRLRSRHRIAGAASLSRFATGPCALEPPGFLCCIPNVMELVANGVPFLSRGSRRAREDAKVAHAAPAPLKIILWPPRSSRCLLAPRCEHAGGFHGLSTPKDSFIASFARIAASLWPFTPGRWLTRIASLRNATVDPARVICLSQRLSHACSAQSKPTPDTLAWDNIIGFRPILLRIGVMINRTMGHSDFIVESGLKTIDTALVSTINDAALWIADVAYRTHAPYEKSKSGFRGVCYAEVTLRASFLEGLWPLRPRKFEAQCIIAIVGLQRGIPSKRSHQPLTTPPPFVHTAAALPIEWSVKCSIAPTRAVRLATPQEVHINLII